MKSHKTAAQVFGCILLDAAEMCSVTNASVMRDLEVIMSRLRDEGMSFLTLTLPTFCDAVFNGIESGRVASSDFPSWEKQKCLPKFLSGYTKLIFESGTGVLFPEPSIPAINCIRQICFAVKKIRMECKADKTLNAFRRFMETERYLSEAQLPPLDDFVKVSKLLWSTMFKDFNPFDLLPKHGPGATQERIYGNQKYVFKTWHERLQSYFPYDSYATVNINQLYYEGMENVKFPDMDGEKPVRVIAVPKTQKGPRIIAIEPVCMQYTQQAVAAYIICKLQSDYITGGHINFTDQSVNQNLAISASISGNLACLDLSDASDRVHADLAFIMLNAANPLLADAVCACRSHAARTPLGDVSLSKFASMGSALCFPIESMFFFTVIACSILRERKMPVTLRNLEIILRDVYVYGDDIFVPTDETESVIETLTQFLCKVNTTKSYWRSSFRESCGVDAFKGIDITPVYIRNLPPDHGEEVQQILSTISTSNQFYLKGFWKTAAFLKNRVEAVIGVLPIVDEYSDALGWYSYQGMPETQDARIPRRWNRDLQRYEYRAFVNRPLYRDDELKSWPALLKILLGKERTKDRVYGPLDIDPGSTDHLDCSSRSGTSSIKRRWILI